MKYTTSSEITETFIKLYDDVPSEQKREVALMGYTALLDAYHKAFDIVEALKKENDELKKVICNLSSEGTGSIMETIQIGQIISALQDAKRNLTAKQESENQSTKRKRSNGK